MRRRQKELAKGGGEILGSERDREEGGNSKVCQQPVMPGVAEQPSLGRAEQCPLW